MSEFSHREAFHRHKANIYNEKEKKSLDAKQKFFDRCRDEKEYSMSKESKELKHQLVGMRREQQRREREGSCLDQPLFLDHDSRQSIQSSQGSHFRLRRTSLSKAEELTGNMTAHEVALHILSKEQSRRTETKPWKDAHTSRQTLQKSDNPKAASWHMTTPIPDVIQSRQIRRHSIADPQDVASNQKQADISAKKKQSKTKRAGRKKKKTSAKNSAKTSSSVVTASDVSVHMVNSDTATTDIETSAVGMAPEEDKEEELKEKDEEKNEEKVDEKQKHPLSLPRKEGTLASGSRNPVTAKIDHSHTGVQFERRSSIRTSTSRRGSLDQASIEHYFDILSANDRAFKEDDRQYETTGDRHGPLGTMKRSHRRKVMALEALLTQLPSFRKHNPDIDPISCLNCSYLRLTPQNIEDLEEECLLAGIDPGMHAHMTEERVQDYFQNHPHLLQDDQ